MAAAATNAISFRWAGCSTPTRPRCRCAHRFPPRRGATDRATHGIDSSAAQRRNPSRSSRARMRSRHSSTALPSRLGRTNPPVILGGFSQGGTSSLAFLMRNPGRVHARAGVLRISRRSSFGRGDPRARARHADLLGPRHRRLRRPVRRGRSGLAGTRAAGAVLDARTYRGMSHTISEEELRDAAAWLRTDAAGCNATTAPHDRGAVCIVTAVAVAAGSGLRAQGCSQEPLVRFELTTARLRIECSTPELQWQPPCDALARTRTAMPFGTTPSR